MLRRWIYFDVRSIRIADDELKQQLINKGLAKADDLKGEVVTTALFRRYMEDYLAKREDVNAQMSLLVRQLEATQAGVPMELYFFLRQKDWIPYEHAMADILEHAMPTPTSLA